MFERLTIKTDICIEPENEIVYHNPNDPEGMYNILDLAECLYSGGEAEAGILMEISRRLAAYEDSDLSPQEVVEIKKYLNMWIEICKENNVSIVQFKKWAKAEQDGRLVVLPCMAGTRVWVIGQNCDMCRDMYAEEPCLFGDCEYKGVFESIFSIGMTDKFGKTVFLTCEEAEKALEGIKCEAQTM
jgi:hypothetical protein